MCAYLGQLSYAAYLWHFPLQVVCADYKKELQARFPGLLQWEVGAFGAQLLLIFGLSAFSYHLVEQPFRRWRPLPHHNAWAGTLVVFGLLAAGTWALQILIAVAEVEVNTQVCCFYVSLGLRPVYGARRGFGPYGPQDPFFLERMSTSSHFSRVCVATTEFHCVLSNVATPPH